MNGVAPGAQVLHLAFASLLPLSYPVYRTAPHSILSCWQIVSLKIGDTRMDAMETGTGLARAFVHCMRSKVDLINLSFGEVVHHYNLTFSVGLTDLVLVRS